MTDYEIDDLVIDAIHDGADADAHRRLFAGLTPDEVRVITGLVRAMRESERRGVVSGRCEGYEGTARVHIGHAAYEIDMALAVDEPGALEAVRLRAAAWHIAHAISQMASGDEDASRVLVERGW